jgi:sec-independent protein translocase protein TatB
MFDIGFSEVLLIFVLALVVLGPEKLPKVAAQVGRWIGRARGMARQFREQLEEEVNLEEARRTQSATRAPAPESPAPSEVSSSSAVSEGTGTHYPGTATHAPPRATSDAGTMPVPEPEHPVYPDSYSHAHPTDHLGRPVPPSNPEPAVSESGQQDWVGGVTATENPAQTTANAAYAPTHERGT